MSLHAKRNIKGAWHNLFRPKEELLGRESSLVFQRKQLPQCEYRSMLNLEGFAELEGQSGEEILSTLGKWQHPRVSIYWDFADCQGGPQIQETQKGQNSAVGVMQCLVSPFPSEVAIFRDFCSLEIPRQELLKI